MSIRKFNPAFVIFILLVLSFSFQCADDSNNDEPDLNQLMLGAWVRQPLPNLENQPNFDSYYKFWGLGHWCISNSDPETGHIIFHHGGTYTIDGNKYVETITFANESTQGMIGMILEYEISLDGDIFDQVGLNNSYTQKWKRLKD
jgi:hypothetical protein